MSKSRVFLIICSYILMVICTMEVTNEQYLKLNLKPNSSTITSNQVVVITTPQVNIPTTISCTNVITNTVVTCTDVITTTKIVTIKPYISTSKPVYTKKPTYNNQYAVKSTPTKSSRSYSNENSMTFKVTAYDLSEESCGKSSGEYWYGKTSSGYDLRGKSRTQAMTIASDTSILPMGTRVYINFISDNFKKYNGTYTVRDTGGAIHGYILDLYLGVNCYNEMDNFGVQKANVTIQN